MEMLPINKPMNGTLILEGKSSNHQEIAPESVVSKDADVEFKAELLLPFCISM